MYTAALVLILVLLLIFRTHEKYTPRPSPQYIVARHSFIVDFHQYLYLLVEAARIRPVVTVGDCMSSKLTRHNTVVTVRTGDVIERHPCLLPDVFDEIILAYINDTPLLLFPNSDHHIMDTEVEMRDCELTIDDVKVLFRGVLLNRSIASIDSLTWNDDRWRLRILKVSSYMYRQIEGGVVDQGDAGTCGVVSICDALGRVLRERLSPLFLYYTTRVDIEGFAPGRDSGVTLVDTLIAIGRWGVCSERKWPYRLDMMTIRPDAEAYRDAASRRVIEFDIIHGESSIRRELSAGNWIVADVDFPTSAFSERVALTGVIPTRDITQPYYSHSVVIVEWMGDVVKFRNSYGADWGDAGYGYLPVKYLLKDVSNCIVFRGMTHDDAF